MKITRTQFEKWNAQAKNGFLFDLERAIIWSEKRLAKRVKLDNGQVIEYLLDYFPEFERITNEYGVTRNVETGRQIPELRFTVWSPCSSGCFSASGVPAELTAGDPQKNKNYNYLCKLSDDSKIKELIEETTKRICEQNGAAVAA